MVKYTTNWSSVGGYSVGFLTRSLASPIVTLWLERNILIQSTPSAFDELGLSFTRDLCNAIEHYTAREVRINPEAYVYRGMQLRYAVERLLYIQCINSESVFDYYRVHRGELIEAQKLSHSNSIESDIITLLCAQDGKKPRSVSPMIRWLLGMPRRTYGWIKRRYWSRRWPKCVLDALPEILIHVTNVKFARYLAPITDNLNPDSFSYLIASDILLGQRLLAAGHSVVSVPARGSLHQHLFCSYALSIFPQLLHDADEILTALNVLRPKCVAVVEGNAPTDAITSEASHLLGIPCYCIQQGWSPYIHTGFRNMNYTEMFVWGQRFADLLRPHNLQQVFSITGSHALQNRIVAQRKNEVKVLSFFLQSPCALLSIDRYDEFLELIVVVAQAYSSVDIVVREHPGYRLSTAAKLRLQSCSNVHFSIPTTETVSAVISASDMVVSVFSTVLLEALALGVVPLICSIGAMKRYQPAIALEGAAIEVSSTFEARRIIDEIIKEPELLEPIRTVISKISGDFFYPTNAAEKIGIRLSKTDRNANRTD